MPKLLCLDGGGSKFMLGVVENGEIKGEPNVKHPADLPDLKEIISQEIQSNGFSGVAFATAGVILEHTIVKTSPNIKWLNNLNVKNWVDENWKVPCWVINDMEAAAEGENAKGALKDVQNAIIETISTGWGGAEKREGKIYPAEPGHIYAGEEGKNKICGCGRIGCREALYSGNAVQKEILGLFPEKTENGKIQGLNPCVFLDQEAKKGNSWALEIYARVGKGIGETWAGALNRSSALERIVYSGRFAVSGMPFMINSIRKTMLNRIMFGHHQTMLAEEIASGKEKLIVCSELWPQGALIGAALIFEKLETELSTMAKASQN